MFCPYCGTANADDAGFCRECGESLKNTGLESAVNPGPSDIPKPNPMPERSPYEPSNHNPVLDSGPNKYSIPNPAQKSSTADSLTGEATRKKATEHDNGEKKSWLIPMIASVIALIILIILIIVFCKSCDSGSSSSTESITGNSTQTISSPATQTSEQPIVQTSTQKSDETSPQGVYAYIIVTPNENISISVGSSITLTVSAAGNLPDEWYFSVECQSYHPDLNSEWSGESGNTSDIIITGVSASEGPVTFKIYDYNTDECLAATDVYITVTESENNTEQSYAEAYATQIRELRNEYPSLRFGICYIGSIMCPNLVVSTGESWSDHVKVYTMSGDGVQFIGDFGCWGSIGVAFTKDNVGWSGLIEENQMAQGSVIGTYYYVMGTTCRQELHYEYSQVDNYYMIDGETYSSYEALEEKLNAVTSGYDFQSVDYNSCYASDNENISDFIQNPDSYIASYYHDGY